MSLPAIRRPRSLLRLDLLEDRAVPAAQMLDFTLNPAESQLTLSGTVAGAPLSEQGAGSLTTSYSGVIRTTVDLEAGTIRFESDGTSLDAAVSGDWDPLPGGGAGTAPANYGALVDGGALGQAFVAVRDTRFNISTPADGALSGSSPTFSFESDQTLEVTGGTASIRATGVLGNQIAPGDDTLTGETSTNQATSDGTLTDQGSGNFAIVLPVDITIVRTVDGQQITLNVAGTLNGTAQGMPPPTTNQPPVANPDTFSLPPGSGQTQLDVLANDTDPDGDTLTVTGVTAPANGTATVTPGGGSVTYTPSAGFAGTDTFTYTVSDGELTAQAAVTVTIAEPAQSLTQQFAVGTGSGSTVNFYGPTGQLQFLAVPFPNFTGSIRTAVADVTGDGIPDLIAGTGPGRPTEVVVIDGKSQARVFSFQPFEASFTGGVYVSAGDVTGDGVADIIISPDEGGGPRVRILRGITGENVNDFFGIDDPDFRGGARTAIGDVDGDGRLDVLVAAGFGGGPRVAAFDGPSVATGTNSPTKLFPDFFAFEQALRNGAFIAAGDVNGDGRADVIAGGGPGGGPRVLILSGAELLANNAAGAVANPIGNFFAGDVNNRGGIRVAAKDLDGDDRADLVVGAGEGAGSNVTGYSGASITGNGTPPTLFDFTAFPGNTAGVFVG